MQMLIKIAGLVILSSVWHSCRITSKSYDVSSKQTDALFGVWSFMEKTKDPRSEESGLAPFPKTITIESLGKNQGKLTLQLHSQTQPKVYSFSKIRPTKVKSVQVYDNQDTTRKKPYSLKEAAIISYSENVLKVDLEWVKNMEQLINHPAFQEVIHLLWMETDSSLSGPMTKIFLKKIVSN